jgi:hypothetical protein
MKALLRLYRSTACLLFSAIALRAEVREAVAYLEQEVPKWKRANGCYSCHNDGDGLRALIAARRAGLSVDPKAIEDSLPALRAPGEWEAKPLARLQFAAAVSDAAAAGLLDRAALESAAEAIAADQQPDGHWKVEEELAAGSPVTYGPVLATFMARSVLDRAGPLRYDNRIARANAWLAERRPQHGIDLAALVLALNREADRNELVGRQLKNGSWNNEPFDTALARLALGPAHPASTAARRYLMSTQWSGGGWPATTRPAGGDSYAQHISTTAWVLLSLAPDYGAGAIEKGKE